MLNERLTRLLDEPIDWRYKGFPPTPDPVSLRTLPQQGWNLLAGDLLMPVMVLKESALAHNLSLMARYCRDHGVSLAPHGKTPMAPQLLRRQLDAGAWGVSASTTSHVRIYREFGIERILLANELVEPVALHWVAAELAADPRFDFYCLVDSLDAVGAMTEALSGNGAERPLQVLVELGQPGGRAGCRTIEEAKEVASAVGRSPTLELAGLEGYEGAIRAEDTAAMLAAIDGYLRRLRQLVGELAAKGAFDIREEILISVGGSAFFDRVVDELGPPWNLNRPVRVVLRSGSYVTHDSGHYERLSPLAGRSEGGDRLKPALEIWGAVLSRPEKGLAIVGFGKRDASFDLGLPVPRLVRHAFRLRQASGELMVTALNDQHAYVSVPPTDDLGVGDLVGCEISHPCTAFDKWRLIPVVDDGYTVIGGVRTFF